MNRELELIISEHRLRLTTPRRTVFETLQQSREPLSAPGIAAICSGIDRTSIYRTLELFVRLGIVNVVTFGWKQRYELSDPFKTHHHHLSCVKCGRLVDLHSPRIERLVTSIASEHGFEARDHMFEIRGLCDDCTRKG